MIEASPIQMSYRAAILKTLQESPTVHVAREVLLTAFGDFAELETWASHLGFKAGFDCRLQEFYVSRNTETTAETWRDRAAQL